jgi:hypothetical protein
MATDSERASESPRGNVPPKTPSRTSSRERRAPSHLQDSELTTQRSSKKRKLSIPAISENGDRQDTPSRPSSSNTRPNTPSNSLTTNEINILRESLPQLANLEATLDGFAAAQHEKLQAIMDCIVGTVEQKLQELGNPPKAKKSTSKPSARVHIIQDSDDDDEHSDMDGVTSGMPPTLSHLLEFFPWVEEAQVKKIVTGKFNINDLPKLFRDPDARQKNLEDTVHGIVTDLPTGKQKFLIADGKMHTAFPTFLIFVSAFSVYQAIRCAYAPEYGCALAAWIEQLHYHATYAPWSQVLKFAIDYFRKYQTKTPADWLPFDNHLNSVHFTHASRTSSIAQHPATSNPSSVKGTKDTRPRSDKSQVPIQYQVCINFNKQRGCTFQAKFGRTCGRMHNCWSCGKEGHPCKDCPTNPTTYPGDNKD